MRGTGSTATSAPACCSPSDATLGQLRRPPAALDIAGLGNGLLGLIRLPLVLWPPQARAGGTPRPLLLLPPPMICAPFFVGFVRTPKIPFLLAPIITIFL